MADILNLRERCENLAREIELDCMCDDLVVSKLADQLEALAIAYARERVRACISSLYERNIFTGGQRPRTIRTERDLDRLVATIVPDPVKP